jgi:hypothetical protein
MPETSASHWAGPGLPRKKLQPGMLPGQHCPPGAASDGARVAPKPQPRGVVTPLAPPLRYSALRSGRCYHNGSVWPHDNAICASGLMRYGFVEHAQQVATAILDAATHFGHRLPELYCGYSRSDFPAPVPYPTSCSPQAWAAAAPLELLRGLLRLDPQLPDHRLWCAPAIPDRYLPLHLDNLRLGDMELTIHVHGDGWELDGLTGRGIDLVRSPRPPAA